MMKFRDICLVILFIPYLYPLVNSNSSSFKEFLNEEIDDPPTEVVSVYGELGLESECSLWCHHVGWCTGFRINRSLCELYNTPDPLWNGNLVTYPGSQVFLKVSKISKAYIC